MSEDHRSGKRRFLRFEPDEPEIAQVQFAEARADDFFFEAEAVGLVIEESYGGCSLVLLRRDLPEALADGAGCQVKIARMSPLKAWVRRVEPLDDDVCRVGIEYAETS